MTRTDRTNKEFGLLGLLLFIDCVLAAVVARITPFYAPSDEYIKDGFLFAAQHRIYDSFLPVGYSGLLGIAAWMDGQRGVVVLSVALSLLVIVAAWFYLRFLGVSVRATFLLTGLLSLYPDFSLSLHKAQETEVTAVLVFAFVTLLMKAVEEDHFGAVDVGLALTLAYAITVRANLLLFVGICWLVFWRLRVPKAVTRLGLQMLILVICYLGITTAIHGRPFVPKYGLYNLYSGFNEDTQNFTNEEDSLFPVLMAHGIQPPRGAAAFTSENLRDPSMDPIYKRLALEFIREHPGRSVWLIGAKFWNLMRPNLNFHSARSAAGLMKIQAALAVPLWLIAMLLWPHPGPRNVKLVLGLMVACYILPFLLTVSAARFREPLDFFCWMDLGAILWALWAARRERSAATNGAGLEQHPA